MKKRRVVAVCCNNLVRSKLFEKYLLKNKQIIAASCGVGFLSYIFGRHFDDSFRDYDIYFAIDTGVYKKLLKLGISKDKIINLHIPNIYFYFIGFEIFGFHPLSELRRRIPDIMRIYGY